MRAVRVAALYDIHGNLPALEAVLEEVADSDVDVVVCGGDVAWGAMPAETVYRLRHLPGETAFVMGNADREVAQRAGVDDGLDPGVAELNRWCAEQLKASGLRFLESFRPTVSIDIDGIGPTLFCHGSPRSDEEIVTPATPERVLTEMLEGVSEATIVSGHTHVQFDRPVAGRRWINAGSVGMPYEGKPGAYWALLGPDVSLRRTVYDFTSVADAFRASDCPLGAELATVVTAPDSAAQATEHFERLAGRG